MITGGKEIVKKLLGVTLSLAMVASLAACGTSAPKDGKATTQSTEKKAEDRRQAQIQRQIQRMSLPLVLLDRLQEVQHLMEHP